VVGDIDRGGVFASFFGTVALLSPEDQRCVAGFLVNKFRGDPAILAPGLERLRELTGRDVAVIVSDSFGRAWRQGTTDVAIGCAGLTPLVDLEGRLDRVGYELHATVIAVADQIAGAAQLVMGKLDGIPVAVVRGLDVAGEGTASELVMPPERDLFR
jgi:coenzyme F420-0:L-glutamate ligase/coenzyme F420-1:gamma-L-glutamate ligase